ncbi:MAG: hypothetical protein JW702_05940 [Clostridiales bacterium]|nr:hypothetical protein [Clostridiales bacterium]
MLNLGFRPVLHFLAKSNSPGALTFWHLEFAEMLKGNDISIVFLGKHNDLTSSVINNLLLKVIDFPPMICKDIFTVNPRLLLCFFKPTETMK